MWGHSPDASRRAGNRNDERGWPVAGGSRGFIATFIETSGVHGGSAELRCVRDPAGATLVDGDDQPTSGLTVAGAAARLDFAAGELFRVKVDLGKKGRSWNKTLRLI